MVLLTLRHVRLVVLLMLLRFCLAIGSCAAGSSLGMARQAQQAKTEEDGLLTKEDTLYLDRQASASLASRLTSILLALSMAIFVPWGVHRKR